MGLRIQVFPAAGFQCHLCLCGLGSKIVAVSPGFPDNGVPRWNLGHRSTIAVQDTPRKNSQGISETYGPVFWIMRQRVEKYGTSPGRHERGSNRSEGSFDHGSGGLLRPRLHGSPGLGAAKAGIAGCGGGTGWALTTSRVRRSGSPFRCRSRASRSVRLRRAGPVTQAATLGSDTAPRPGCLPRGPRAEADIAHAHPTPPC